MYETELRKAMKWWLSLQKEDGSFELSEGAIDGHYKAPVAMLEMGHLREATRRQRTTLTTTFTH